MRTPGNLLFWNPERLVSLRPTMKWDEFAFVNQQLAAMLRTGIPLEGALEQLCRTMASGQLRGELDTLRADLAAGTPLKDALARRKLPELYVGMIRAGAAGNDLPGVLTLLADYYRQLDSLWSRLKGVMVYPLIVLVASLALAGFLTVVATGIKASLFGDVLGGTAIPVAVSAMIWAPFVFLAFLTLAVAMVLALPGVRARLAWRVPPFREAQLARLASAMGILLRGGCTLDESLALLEQLEQGTPVRKLLAEWRRQLAAGETKSVPINHSGDGLPGMFLWAMENGDEDLARGFARTAELYRARAAYRSELVLYGALPVAVLALGLLIVGQLFAVLVPMLKVISTMGAM